MLVVSCGDGGAPRDGAVDTGAEPPSPARTRSGTRLEVRWWDAGEGALAFSGLLHDTDLDVDCSIQTAADGRRRCLPATAGYQIGFADPACTQPVAIRRACAVAEAYVLGSPRPTASCAALGGTPVYAAGASRAERTFYVASPDCTPMPIDEGMELVALGEEIPPERFVGADLVAGSGAPLSPRSLVADDGTVLAVSIYDHALGAECAAAGATASPVCAPTARAFSVLPVFADATCSQLVAIDTGLVPPCERATAAWDVSMREGYLGYARVGEEVLGPRYARSDAARCEPDESIDPPRAWLLGAPFEEGDFARLVNVTDGAGRVVALRTEAADGTPLAHATQLRDTETGTECRPVRFPDGYRCISGSSAADLFYSDASCTTPIVLRDASGGPAPMATSHHRSGDACDPVEADGVFAVGERVSPAGVWVLDLAGVCRARTPTPDAVYYARGPAIEAPRLDLR